ncbi:MAG: DUF4493 domain-containing protein [Bacteroides sp.]|nr:DUF4493 domain-containing protein [Bacteroides sp.]MCM1412742.1 DUF4493 domain-containing protein [Bacteroides sp.]MCM1470964.1 DUF4493 domain-containing protein [Bacteroides sp.]
MNNRYNIPASCLLAILLVLFTTACSQDTYEDHSGSSLLQPQVTINPTIFTNDGPVSSGIIDFIPDPQDFSINVASADGRYSNTWPTLASYPMREPYRPGVYVIRAFYGSTTGEGFDMPFFYGTASADLISGQTATATIDCSLANAIFDIRFSDSFRSYFSDASARLHAAGGAYFSFSVDETRKAYLRPGKITLILSANTPDGVQFEINAFTIAEALKQNLYQIDVDLQQSDSGNPLIVISTDPRVQTDDTSIELTAELLAATPPMLSAVGFTSESPLSIIEGTTPDKPCRIDLSGTPATSLTLTTTATSLLTKNWPEEIDLCSATPSQLATLERLGLVINRSGSTITSIDFTGVVPNLRSTDASDRFYLTATSAQGKMAGPLMLNIDVLPVDISVISVSDAIIGVNIARMTILSGSNDLSSNLMIETSSDGGTSWSTATINSIEAIAGASNEYDVIFQFDNPATSSVMVRVTYCGQLKATETITLIAPQFSFEIDPFAQHAVVKIITDDPSMARTITSIANVYLNNNQTPPMQRVPDQATIYVGGLTPSTSYQLKISFFDKPTSPGQYTSPMTFTTEQALAVPNGGFEDVRNGVRYKDLPAGGLYSQNIVDIFNQQNYASFDQYVPKHWANVNAKTFCTLATNHNTWYMQPSAWSVMDDCTEGAYSVCLQSTAWDLNGPAIEPYRQPAPPYVKYSRNIPQIANRAAGKLFLGEYGFNPATGEETYVEGVSFKSRPLALNGSYRYLPSMANQNDRAIIRIEIIGTVNNSEVVIASADTRLPVASGFKAFSIPLSYSDFAVKATKLKIMIASSETIGSIAYENQNIITLSDPVTSTSLGSTLWIDDLTFSY